MTQHRTPEQIADTLEELAKRWPEATMLREAAALIRRPDGEITDEMVDEAIAAVNGKEWWRSVSPTTAGTWRVDMRRALTAALAATQARAEAMTNDMNTAPVSRGEWRVDTRTISHTTDHPDLRTRSTPPSVPTDEMVEALQKFVDHYPMGINPSLDEAYRKARAIFSRLSPASREDGRMGDMTDEMVERAAKAAPNMGDTPKRLGLQIHVERRKLMVPYLCIYLTWDGERIAGDFINIDEILTP